MDGGGRAGRAGGHGQRAEWEPFSGEAPPGGETTEVPNLSPCRGR